MCGIIGFSSGNSFSGDKIKMLFLYNEERGRDSTGFYTPESGIVKNTDRSSTFIYKTKIKESNILIGHCRKSSMGYITSSNAHPFEIDNIVGVHNGHIKNHNILTTYKERDYFNINIDSQSLFYLLSKYKDPRVLYHIDGAMAILFMDKRTKTLYAFRNNERPLFYGKIKDNMYISSIECSLVAIGCENVKEFVENCLYQIESGKIIKKLFLKNTNKLLKITKKNFKNGKYKINTQLIDASKKDENGKDIVIATKNSIADVSLAAGDKFPTFKSIFNNNTYNIKYEYLERLSNLPKENSFLNEERIPEESNENKLLEEKTDKSTDIIINDENNNIITGDVLEDDIFNDETVHPVISGAFDSILTDVKDIINKYILKFKDNSINIDSDVEDMKIDVENNIIDTYNNTKIMLENEI